MRVMKRWMLVALSGGLLVGGLSGGIALGAHKHGAAMHHKHGAAMHHSSAMHDQTSAMHDAAMSSAELTG